MSYWKLLRTHQWIKNLLIFFPVIFEGRLLDDVPWVKLVGCFIVFCLASSAVYVMNDIMDAERDKQHPIKKKRPIASGLIKKSEAWMFFGGLTMVAMISAYQLSKPTVLLASAYMGLNVLYSLYTKHVPLLDCTSIAFGFCLRFLAGAIGFFIPVNVHLLIACFFGALTMALLKRRIELSNQLLLNKLNASKHQDKEPAKEWDKESRVEVSRPSLKNLNLSILDLLIGINCSVGLNFYAQWTTTPNHPMAILTLPLLSILLARVAWLGYLNKKGEDFSKTLLSDPFALYVCLGFIAVLVFAVWPSSGI